MAAENLARLLAVTEDVASPWWLSPWLWVVLLLAIAIFALFVWISPTWMTRFYNWAVPHILYNIKVVGAENVPKTGGVLLICNHVSWGDGTLMNCTSPRWPRSFAWAANFKSPWLKRSSESMGIILMTQSPKSMLTAIRTARQALQNGEVVTFFPEGGVTRTGQLQGFKPGVQQILKDTNATVIPVFIDGMWGSFLSYSGDKLFGKWPGLRRRRVTVSFGKPMAATESVHTYRQAVQQLGATSAMDRKKHLVVLPRQFIRQCKRNRKRLKIADTSGTELTGGSLLLRTQVLRRLIARELSKDEKFVGLLLPPSAGGFLANMAVSLMKRVAVNLNYTATSEIVNNCIEQAGIKHVITSRRVFDKLNLKLDAELIFLEDLVKQVKTSDKISAALLAYATPSWLAERMLGLHRIKPDDLLTVIFTSGSTGMPKGVMLSHANLASNVEATRTVINLKKEDSLVGILPFFHSLGYMANLWLAAALDPMGAFHYSPLDGRQVGAMAKKYGCTLLLSPPTFLRSYLKRCSEEDFAKLQLVVTGAEKLPADLADAFEAKFKIRPVEGYGTTELSPLVSVNIPPGRAAKNFQIDRKEGTVGRPVPGVTVKTIDLETGAPLDAGQQGMLLVTGPNVMQGYMNHPEKTAEVIRDGWYVTGDLAIIDDDGFIQITGRESRFSKIGGEMVPHITIEEKLNELLKESDDEPLKAAVTAVSDPTRGERIVVLHTKITKEPRELTAALAAAGLPNLFIPSPDSFIEVAQLPILGSGKLDLKGVKKLAEEKLGG